MKKTIHVVVGLIFNPAKEVLLTWRDSHKIPGNCWEFPGGKIEVGESQYQALCRELKEEIGIEVQQALKLSPLTHEYETLMVQLYPWQVQQYQGIPQGLEGQKLCWAPFSELRDYVLPAANYAILDLI